MAVEKPHGSPLESTEFWYSTAHNALLYEVTVNDKGTQAEPDHGKGSARLAYERNFPHDHSSPHGLEFSELGLPEVQQQANIANVEMIVRLWNQAEEKSSLDQPWWPKRCIFPVPKLLALFLAARRTQMHKEESISQALLLLQVYLSSKTRQ